jgi:hypothetical protein
MGGGGWGVGVGVGGAGSKAAHWLDNSIFHSIEAVDRDPLTKYPSTHHSCVYFPHCIFVYFTHTHFVYFFYSPPHCMYLNFLLFEL